MDSNTKHCKDCQQTKPVDDFYRNNQKGGRQSICKHCDHKRRGRGRYGSKPSRMTRNEKDAALHKLLAAYTAERDAYNDSVTDAEGNVLEEQDTAELARMDAIIDDARRALGLSAPAAPGGTMDGFLRRVA